MAVALVLSLTAFDRESDPPEVRDAAPVANPYEDGRRAGAQALLDEWAKTVRSGDTAALSALFDSGATPGFLDAEIRRSNNLAQVPFSEFGYDIGLDAEVPVPPTVAEELGASDVWAPTVYFRYAIAGADAQPTRKPVALLLARRGNEWKLVSDSNVTESGRETWRGPWDFGPVITRVVDGPEGRSSIVLGHPGQVAMVDRIAGDLGPAVAHVTDVWGQDWSRRAVVLVAGSHEEFASLVGAAHSGADIAAVSVSDAVDLRSRTASGQRIVFSPESADRLTDLTRVSVLRHELTHIAARTVTEDGSPLWILEGYADYVGYRGVEATFGALAPTLSAEVAKNGPPTSLPADADFGAGGDTARRAYESSWSLAAFVAGEYGEEKLDALYRSLAQGAATGDRLDGRIRDALGVDADGLAQAWGAWVEKQVA
ncbi:peptidase MA family metallohydrolase [Rhodococcus sp. ACT016]|uniref:peptidase MA family metallohydrolase n=1 Tax=Rhodococcus sp. ACT016 TaxID=3134808 RepID=UPI003D2D30A1